MIFLIWILNFAISWFNAWAVGKSWVESKAVGGWQHFMNWMGGVMSAVGFSWCYLVILAYIMQATGKFENYEIDAVFSLGYLIIIVPCIGSGLAITVDSWAHFWRRKSLGGGVVAGWNTFAQISNTYRAISAVPRALSSVGEVLGGSKGGGKSKNWVLLILLAILAVAGGVMTTMAIVTSTARSHVRSVFPGGRRREYA